MNKQGFVVVVLSLVVVITLIAAAIHEKSIRKEHPASEVQVEQSYDDENFRPQPRTPDFEKMEKTGVYDPNDPGLTPPPVMSNQGKQQPNAFDAMAPGYKKANIRLKHAKELRRKSLEAQRKQINDLNLDR